MGDDDNGREICRHPTFPLSFALGISSADIRQFEQNLQVCEFSSVEKRSPRKSEILIFNFEVWANPSLLSPQTLSLPPFAAAPIHQTKEGGEERGGGKGKCRGRREIRMDVGSQPRQKRRKEEGFTLARAEEDAISAVEAEGGICSFPSRPLFSTHRGRIKCKNLGEDTAEDVFHLL